MKKTMKKFFSFKNVALAGMAMAAVLSSCSSDDDTVNVNVDSEVAKSGVAAVEYDGVYNVDVKSNGKWTASVPEDCDWVGLYNTEGEGNGKLAILVDRNTTGIDRSATISLSTGDETKTFVLSQTAGEGANDAEYINLASGKYLGCGFKLAEYVNADGKFVKNNVLGNAVIKGTRVVNAAGVNTLMQSDPVTYSTLLETTPVSILEYQSVNADSIVQKQDELGVHIDVHIGYGLMKFGIEGDYHGKEHVTSGALKLRFASNYPTLESSLDYPSLVSAYTEYLDDKNKKGVCGGVFSVGYSKDLERLVAACKSGDQDKKKRQIIKFVNSYGTGVISSSTLGGMLALQLDVDSATIVEKMSLDSAKISTTIKSGLFSLDANVKASYSDSAAMCLQHSAFILKAVGGDKDKATEILSSMRASSGLDAKALSDNISKSIEEWAKSITIDKNLSKNNSEMIDLQVTPIWNFIGDADTSEDVRKYILEKYANTPFAETYEWE